MLTLCAIDGAVFDFLANAKSMTTSTGAEMLKHYTRLIIQLYMYIYSVTDKKNRIISTELLDFTEYSNVILQLQQSC